MVSFSKLIRSKGLAAGFLLLVCAAMFLPGLGTAMVARQQEMRVVLASRTMAEGGSWLVPQFMGEERLRKPPLMYWLVASAFKAAGSTENITAARTVSTISATALVLATFFCGRRFVGRRAAFLGALVLASSMGFLRHARLAETDMAQATFCALAIFALYAALTDRGRSLPAWALTGLFAGIGFMIKGPASLAMPTATAVAFLLVGLMRNRRRRDELAATPAWKNWTGLLIALLIFLAIASPWYIAIAMQVSADSKAQAGDEISRLLVESRHHGPFVYYLYTLPMRLGVWGLLLPVAVFGAARRVWHHRAARFILCWFASAFVILSALKSKQEHYALLLFVPSALLCGWLLAQALRRTPTFYSRFARGYTSFLCILFAVAGVTALASRLIHLPASSVPLRDAATPMLVCCGAIGVAGFLKRRNAFAGILAVLAIMALVMAFQMLRLERFQTGYSIVPDLFDANRKTLDEAPHVIVAGQRAPIMEWYAGRTVRAVTNNVAAVWRDAVAGDVLIASERGGRTNIVSQLSEAPLAGASHLDVSITLYRKAAEVPR